MIRVRVEVGRNINAATGDNGLECIEYKGFLKSDFDKSLKNFKEK